MAATKRYKSIERLIHKITRSEQSSNDTFCFYGHLVVLQSGTTDYMDVMVYNTTDPYSGMFAEFTFDYWTHELYIISTENEDMEQAIIRAFKGIYGYVKVSCEQEE